MLDTRNRVTNIHHKFEATILYHIFSGPTFICWWDGGRANPQTWWTWSDLLVTNSLICVGDLQLQVWEIITTIIYMMYLFCKGLLLFYPHYCDMTYQPPQTMLLSVNPHPSHISTSLTVSPPLGSCGPPRHHEDLVASHAQTNGLVSALQASRPQAAKGKGPGSPKAAGNG